MFPWPCPISWLKLENRLSSTKYSCHLFTGKLQGRQMFYQDMLYSGNSELYDHFFKTDREFILTYKYRSVQLIYIFGNPRKYVCCFSFNQFFVFVVINKLKRNKALISFVEFMLNTWFNHYCLFGRTCLSPSWKQFPSSGWTYLKGSRRYNILHAGTLSLVFWGQKFTYAHCLRLDY